LVALIGELPNDKLYKLFGDLGFKNSFGHTDKLPNDKLYKLQILIYILQ
jgi:hypothetical protein